MAKKKVHLKNWKDKGKRVKLIYPHFDSFYVSKEDFNCAFGCIVSGEKTEIKRDFAIKRQFNPFKRLFSKQ